MSRVRILAFEDEDLHAEKLKMIADMVGYDLQDILSSADNALGRIAALKPDIILMDINLGDEKTGIEIAREINDIFDIPIIFVTSHKDLSTFEEAMKAQPDAYITKPYDAVNLQAAITICSKKKNYEAGLSGNDVAHDTLYIRMGKSFMQLKLDEILFVEAYDKYCYINTREKKILHNQLLGEMNRQLPSSQFIQVHRSFIINIKAIEKINPVNSKIEIAGKIIPVSRTYKKALFSRLKLV